MDFFGLGFLVSSFRNLQLGVFCAFLVSGFGFRIEAGVGREDGQRVPGSGSWFLGSGSSGFECRILGFGFRFSGFGIQVLGFGCRVSGLRSRVSGFGLRSLSFGFRVSGAEPKQGCDELMVRVKRETLCAFSTLSGSISKPRSLENM